MPSASSRQSHLDRRDTVNLGGYYTNPRLTGLAYKLLARHRVALDGDARVLDTSCGYGSFLSHPAAANAVRIGADIDAAALEIAKREVPDARLVLRNGLLEASRKAYGIGKRSRLVIVGNPPYNDVTALAARAEKTGARVRDGMEKRYVSRDLGISFMRAYADLAPDFVCVLHPLSYLIKKANFVALKDFARRYALVDAVVVSSAEFGGTAKGASCFPIVVALYRPCHGGMDWEYVRRFKFKTDCGKSFRVSDFTPLSDFVTFYPNAGKVPVEKTVARFHTLRDINALRRNRAFVENDGPNTIRVTAETLPYFRYAAEFKRRLDHVPYYLGNFPPFIDAVAKLPAASRFDAYFKRLLGEHYLP